VLWRAADHPSTHSLIPRKRPNVRCRNESYKGKRVIRLELPKISACTVIL